MAREARAADCRRRNFVSARLPLIMPGLWGTEEEEKSNNGWLIGGAAVGAVMVLVVIGFLIYLCVRKCRKKSNSGSESLGSGSLDPLQDVVTEKNARNSRYERKVPKQEEPVTTGSTYFIQLAKKIHVRSISDYKIKDKK